jgi:Na+-driven multidrug efflux pump
LTASSKYILNAWIGADLNISTELTIAAGVLILVISWNNIFAMLINGLGLIKPQLYTSVLAMLGYIPLAVYIAENTHMGTSSVPVAAVIALLPASIALPIQVYNLLHFQRNKLSK